MKNNISKDFLINLPKAELHLHLEGTLEPDLKLALAKENQIDIGQDSIEEIKASYQFDDLASFLAVYYPAMNVLQKEADFYRLAMAYLKRARENGVRYVEMFFDPQAHTSRGISFKEVINGYYRATQDALDLGIKSQLIMCFLRDLSAESAMEHYEMALPYRDQIVGIGLDSDEFQNPPLKFKEVFARAKADGFHITMHCDVDQVDSIKHIRDCLLEIGVERLDHGTNIVEDPQLVEYVLEKGIGLTCCPCSNTFVSASMKGKEILELLNKGVKITINSDDPAYFGGYIGTNMVELQKEMDLSQAQVAQLAKNSFDIAFISEEEKASYRAEVDRYTESSNNL